MIYPTKQLEKKLGWNHKQGLEIQALFQWAGNVEFPWDWMYEICMRQIKGAWMKVLWNLHLHSEEEERPVRCHELKGKQSYI